MSRDKKCRRCGDLDEYLYDIELNAVYYCATCNVERHVTHEVYGPEEQMAEEAGE